LKKLSDKVLAITVWSEVQMICIPVWSTWCHCLLH